MLYKFTPAEIAAMEAEAGLVFERRAAGKQGRLDTLYAEPNWNLMQAGLYDYATQSFIPLKPEINSPDVPPQRIDHTHPSNSTIPTPQRKRGRKSAPSPYDHLPEPERTKAKLADYMRRYRANKSKK